MSFKVHRPAPGCSLIEGEALAALQVFKPDRFDSVVSDPPYELGFMGKGWDASGIAFSVEFWRAVLRVLKPGGHLLAFGGTRTYHRMACAIEDAGFEVRDSLHWFYGVGFPKSLNLLKAMQAKGEICECEASSERDVRPVPDPHVPASVDAAAERREVLLTGLSEPGAPHEAGSEWVDCDESRELRGEDDWGEEPGVEGRGHVPQRERKLQGAALRAVSGRPPADGAAGRVRDGAPARDGSPTRATAGAGRGRSPQGPRPKEQRAGKPAAVPEQPSAQAGRSCGSCGKVRAESVAGMGTALKPAHEPVILARKPLVGTVAANVLAHGTGGLAIDACRLPTDDDRARAGSGGKGLNALGHSDTYDSDSHPGGRWPANVLLDEHAAAELDEQSGTLTSGLMKAGTKRAGRQGVALGVMAGDVTTTTHADSGGASRFFYVSKPSRRERDQGCAHLPAKSGGEATDRQDDSAGVQNPRAGANRGGNARNTHPTVKPVQLMRYLVRLVTPPGGCVLDPFTGSGTTGMAARLERLAFVGIEREPEYATIAAARIASATPPEPARVA